MTPASAPTISGGRLRGLRLAVPPGSETRPTRAKLREALFATLGRRVEGARMLDLFAGSGALGIEALSRGALHCTFVERAPRALLALRENLLAAGLAPEEAAVQAIDCAHWTPLPGARFDIVLADPPYALRDPLPAALFDPGTLAPGAWLCLESAAARVAPVALRVFRLLRQRVYGQSALALYVASDAAPEA